MAVVYMSASYSLNYSQHIVMSFFSASIAHLQLLNVLLLLVGA